MPSTSKKQHNFMAMVAHNPKMAKKVGVPQSVGAEFTAADKGKKFKNGGGPVFSKIKNLFKGKDDPKEEMKEAKAIKSGKITPAQYAKGEKMEKAMPVHRGKTKKFKAGGKVKCYNGVEDGSVIGEDEDSGSAGRGNNGLPAEPKAAPKPTPKPMPKPAPKPAFKKFAKGGGIESKGKTRGRFV